MTRAGEKTGKNALVGKSILTDNITSNFGRYFGKYTQE